MRWALDRGTAPGRAAERPVAVARGSCTLRFAEGGAGTVACGAPRPALRGPAAPKPAASAALAPFGPYAVLSLTHLVKDTVAQAWSVDARVKNRLAEPLGTLDGVTVLGVSAVITGVRVSAGTGTAAVADPDGETTSTAPGQPYVRWAEAVAPRATSGVRTWRFHVPKTATAIDVDLAIVGDFPAELSVPPIPVDSEPAWFADDSSWVNEGRLPGGFLKHVVVVLFREGTSAADRALAVALVGGTVIGGIPFRPDGDGYYYLWLPDGGTGAQLRAAAAKLQSLPQVFGAHLLSRAEPAYRRPKDGAGWERWSLNPDSLSATGHTSALGLLNAPMA